MDKRVSPVFDVSRYIDLYESEGYGSRAVFVSTCPLPASLEGKVGFLSDCGVDTLVCGAISREGELSLVLHDIEVYSFIRGTLSEVLEGWEKATLEAQIFLLPGCKQPHHLRRMRQCQRRNGRCMDR